MTPVDRAGPPDTVVLWIDLPQMRKLPQVQTAGRIVHISYAALDAVLLAQILPDVIALPLFARGFDAVQAVSRLVDLGYGGRLCVICPSLPDRSMVEAELRSRAGIMQIDLIAE
jgi:hypothetical protein